MKKGPDLTIMEAISVLYREKNLNVDFLIPVCIMNLKRLEREKLKSLPFLSSRFGLEIKKSGVR
jgi:hypothetical protein